MRKYTGKAKGSFCTFLCLVMIIKIAIGTLCLPMVIWLFESTLSMSNHTYLDMARIQYFLGEPYTITVLVLCICVWVVFAIVELFVLIRYFYTHVNRVDETVLDTIYYSSKQVGRMFYKGNRVLLLYATIWIVLLHVAGLFSLFMSIRLPFFLYDAMQNHRQRTLACFFTIGCLFFFVVRYGYIFHVFALQIPNAKQAMHITRFAYRRTSTLICDIQLRLFVVASICVLVSSGVLAWYCFTFVEKSLQYGTMLRLMRVVSIVVYGIVFLLSMPLQVKTMTYQYVKQHPDIQRCYIALTIQERKRMLHVLYIGFIGVVCLNVLAGYNVYYKHQKGVTLLHELLEQPQIIAHRGDSTQAPENTIASFQKAMQDGVDWVELDVHQTKDQVLVVVHDADLQRVSGQNVNIYDVTYEELQKYDVGSWFSKTYKGERVPTLEEVIQLCKNKVKLNIELKPTGHEVDFEENVVRLIHRYHVQKQCVVSSIHKAPLQNVKLLDPNIKTQYTMMTLFGKLKLHTYADYISIEASYITKDVLDEVHGKGMKLTAWTINQEDHIKEMIHMGVDNIVTDHPLLVQQVLWENAVAPWIVMWVRPWFV